MNFTIAADAPAAVGDIASGVNVPAPDVTSLTAPVQGTEIPALATTEPAQYDVTADQTIPVEVSPEFGHISAFVDTASVVSYDPLNPNVYVDIVMSVNVTNTALNTTSTHKVVKRLSMDKIKLALAAELQAPVQIVEHVTPEQEAVKAKKLAEEQLIKRMKSLAGLN